MLETVQIENNCITRECSIKELETDRNVALYELLFYYDCNT